MPYYETLYIVNPNYEQERLDEIIQNVTRESKKHKLKTINHRIWGKKRLAYSIANHKYGTYMLFQFETDNSADIQELDRFLKLHQAIIRSHTIRLDRRPETAETPVEQESGGAKQKSAGGGGTREDRSPREPSSPEGSGSPRGSSSPGEAAAPESEQPRPPEGQGKE